MKEKKSYIWSDADVPKKNMGRIHALCLQMMAKGIIGFAPASSANVRTDKFSNANVVVTLPNATAGEDGVLLHAYSLPESWHGMTTV